ncbi:MAG TPA: hypothetical protein VH062_09755 [Polyangiaceae bacterium]|jgi:hypothetical protein|nr:hypothetical protein [Polyangiaceae bacterium]
MQISFISRPYIYTLVSALGCIALTGCGSGSAVPDSMAKDKPVGELEELARIDVEPGHVITFSRSENDTISVSEVRAVDQRSIMPMAPLKMTLDRLYTTLRPNELVPEKILRVVANVATSGTTTDEKTAVAAKTEAETTGGMDEGSEQASGATPEVGQVAQADSSEAAWYTQNYCNWGGAWYQWCNFYQNWSKASANGVRGGTAWVDPQTKADEITVVTNGSLESRVVIDNGFVGGLWWDLGGTLFGSHTANTVVWLTDSNFVEDAGGFFWSGSMEPDGRFTSGPPGTIQH